MAKTGNKTKISPAKAKKTTAKSTGGSKKDTVAVIRNYLFSMHELGMETVPETQVLIEADYARPDSTGYRKAMKELIKELGHVEKVAAGKYKLTEKGMQSATPSDGGAAAKISNNCELAENFKVKILKVSKGVPAQKLDAIWDVLSDGKSHSPKELLEAAGYKRKDSTGYREIIKWMNNLGLIEKIDGCFQFIAEKVFPFPN